MQRHNAFLKKDKAIDESDLFRWILVFTLANVYNRVNDKYRLHDNALTRVKGAIRIRISKKNRQHNGQKKKYKRTNNDLQNTHINLKIE